MELAETLGSLKKSGWQSTSVAAELRRNVAKRIRAGESVIDSVAGYENTVLPQLENALLAGHDVIFLGERGQAKTRMIRGLTDLLDEWMPTIAGSEINDDPYHPVSAAAREVVENLGDDAPIRWVHRSERYGEKLATPDTSIADLIGEVDPIKVAEGRYLSDELTIHYGLVPRTNRGIFAINELPDLAERIQVGLLNVLEERDVQIRGYKVRLPLDVVLFASANPEDYTNRGRIITPLKDRFGSQIRTHYPLDVDTEIEIIESEVVLPDEDVATVRIPAFMTEIVAELSQQARQSPHINQRSGVSVRLSVSNLEALVAAATRRSLANGDEVVAPRIADLEAMLPTTAGKIELEAFEDGVESKVIASLIRSAVNTTFMDAVDRSRFAPIVAAFDDGLTFEAGEGVGSDIYAELLGQIPELDALVDELLADDPVGGDHPTVRASAVEFILEGLHLAKRLNKLPSESGTSYSARS